MPETTGETSSAPKPADDQLNSWKEIAAYFSRDVTTVQRWEKREGMPVHRHLHDKMGSAYAFRAELATWARSRNVKGEGESMAVFVMPGPVLSPHAATPADVTNRSFPLLLRPLAIAGAASIFAIGAVLLLRKTDYLWRNPIDGAQFQTITDFDGIASEAAISRDGHFVAFLSDHDGPMDVWLSQIGSGQFHNLTHGSAGDIVNPFVRTLGFSVDSSLVTFWVRKQEGSDNGISIWAVPTLGGQPRPYLEGVAEFDWSRDGTQLAYHTPGPGHPLIVSDTLKHRARTPSSRRPLGFTLISALVSRCSIHLLRPRNPPG